MKRFIYLLWLLSMPLASTALFFHRGTDMATKQLVHSKPKDLVQNLTEVLPEHPLTIGGAGKQGIGAKENAQFFDRVADSIDDSNFAKIKVDVEVAQNEIDFWGRQVSEHALFAHLGLEDSDMKARALKTHKALENFRAKFKKNPTDLDHMNTILPLLRDSRNLQIEGLKSMESGKWVGWFFPSYFNHVTLELDYFIDKLNGVKYTPEEEVAFFNRINGEHAVFTSHFLDPVEAKLITQSDNMAHTLRDIPKNEKEMMVKLSLIAAKELDKFNKDAQAHSTEIKSIIHPVLLDHMIREGERSIQTLSNLGLHKEAEEMSRTHKRDMEQYAAEIK